MNTIIDRFCFITTEPGDVWPAAMLARDGDTADLLAFTPGGAVYYPAVPAAFADPVPSALPIWNLNP